MKAKLRFDGNYLLGTKSAGLSTLIAKYASSAWSRCSLADYSPSRAGELPARHAKLVEQFQFTPELRAGDFAAQELAVSCNRLGYLFRRFVEKLHAEMARAQSLLAIGCTGSVNFG